MSRTLCGMRKILFSGRSLQGLTILIASAWLLLFSTYSGFFGDEHSSYLGRRDFSVTNPPIIDLSGARAERRFGHQDSAGNLSSSFDGPAQDGALSKRVVANEAQFQSYKRKGDIAFNALRAAFEGCEENVQAFGRRPFINGWSRWIDTKSLPDHDWDDVLAGLLREGEPLTNEQSFHVVLNQDKPFINNRRERIEQYEELAQYDQFYIPSIAAIVISDMRSPANQVKRRFERERKPIPSNQEISERWVPPLNRWSDVTWLMWKEKNGGNNLRYIGHDYITNEASEAIMRYIFNKYRHSQVVPWPGLDFTMDKDEGRALLGTPNGIGTARLLIDRAADLGRRDLKVYIWTFENDHLCMLWDMVPVQPVGRHKRDPRGDDQLYRHLSRL